MPPVHRSKTGTLVPSLLLSYHDTSESREDSKHEYEAFRLTVQSSGLVKADHVHSLTYRRDAPTKLGPNGGDVPSQLCACSAVYHQAGVCSTHVRSVDFLKGVIVFGLEVTPEHQVLAATPCSEYASRLNQTSAIHEHPVALRTYNRWLFSLEVCGCTHLSRVGPGGFKMAQSCRKCRQTLRTTRNLEAARTAAFAIELLCPLCACCPQNLTESMRREGFLRVIVCAGSDTSRNLVKGHAVPFSRLSRFLGASL